MNIVESGSPEEDSNAADEIPQGIQQKFGEAILLLKGGKYEDAKELFRQILDWCQTLPESEFSQCEIPGEVGAVFCKWEYDEDAAAILEKALLAKEKLRGDDNLETLQDRLFLAKIFYKLGWSEKASDLNRRNIDLCEKNPDDFKTAIALESRYELVIDLQHLSKHEEAIKISREEVVIWEKYFESAVESPEDDDLVRFNLARHQLAISLHNVGTYQNYKEAEELCMKNLDSWSDLGIGFQEFARFSKERLASIQEAMKLLEKDNSKKTELEEIENGHVSEYSLRSIQDTIAQLPEGEKLVGSTPEETREEEVVFTADTSPTRQDQAGSTSQFSKADHAEQENGHAEGSKNILSQFKETETDEEPGQMTAIEILDTSTLNPPLTTPNPVLNGAVQNISKANNTSSSKPSNPWELPEAVKPPPQAPAESRLTILGTPVFSVVQNPGGNSERSYELASKGEGEHPVAESGNGQKRGPITNFENQESSSTVTTMTISKKAKAAKEWLARVEEMNNVLRQKPPRKHKIKSVTSKYERVKVAILDTGIDGTHPYWNSIAGYKDFVLKGNEQGIDNTGHGTNGVYLILEILPEADVYVARVFQGEEAKPDTPSLAAEAIDYARSEWKVNIITMSCGFKDNYSKITRAIQRANAADILVFASAANWGSKDSIAFPARLQGSVICIFSSDGSVKPSESFNPRPSSESNLNFCVLGEEVEKFQVSASHAKEFASGTSIATSIAAALAGCVIDFSRQDDCRNLIDNREELETVAGMSAIFRAMANKVKDNGYDCVAPWRLLKCSNDYMSGWDRERQRQHICKRISIALENMHQG